MNIGYARISTNDQNLDMQIDALQAAGCEKIFSDKGISGAKYDREGLNNALVHLREGDVLTVWRLDRIGRSLKHLIEIVNTLKDRGVGFRSLHESIDTTTPAGRLTFHLFGSLCEFERDLIRERTNAGLVAARARGRLGGRKPVLSSKQIQIARTLYENNTPVAEICEQVNCSKATFYRHIVKVS
ncbi:MAG: recombinase family protein [Fibrobacter sp.]|nr:recombinase family protein [Fibrobacter sp.]